MTIAPAGTLIEESRANTWYGSAGSGSRRCTRTPACSYTDTISACWRSASSRLNAMPDASVAREIALVGSQRKWSGGQSSTSSSGPYSESTPQAVSDPAAASMSRNPLSS